MIQSARSHALELHQGVDRLRASKRAQHGCNDWFYVQEIRRDATLELQAQGLPVTEAMHHARLLIETVRRMPLHFLPGQAIAGSMDGAFSPSYALINPAFRTASFKGFCDPCAIYDDIHPDLASGITQERIETVRSFWKEEAFARGLNHAYAETAELTSEVVFFAEPVTGHIVPDLRQLLRDGVEKTRERARRPQSAAMQAMAAALEAPLILAERYATLAEEAAANSQNPDDARQLREMAHTLRRVPREGATSLQEAVQSFAILWMCMVLEQSPNPYAISTGGLDRVLEPYFDPQREEREEAVALVRHLLAFFQVADRCWAISQNIMAGGCDESGTDLTGRMTSVLLDAFYASNDPQPALSVKLHRQTPEELYRSLGRFFFTPGHLTPSLFNDDSLQQMLRTDGIAPADLADYGIAGCQEPLVMGKSSINTTNTWLNLAKVLELALNDGVSMLTGKQLTPSWRDLGYASQDEAYANMPAVFFATLDAVLPRLEQTGNAFTTLLGTVRPAPFTSTLMSGLETGRDLREPSHPGVPYSGSGCLIHGLSVVADSLHALSAVLSTQEATASTIRQALQVDFQGADSLRDLLLRQDKFGNGITEADAKTAALAEAICHKVGALRNPAGDPFKPDFSTPSTHLLYGYWVGATPDGRGARQMLGYGVDPRPGAAHSGLANRLLSAWRLPYQNMSGGYASHIAIDPLQLPPSQTDNAEDKGIWLREEVIAPLFRFGSPDSSRAPFYVYFNVENPGHLRAVLADPSRYAPDGVYIVRIHGTFVNLLDLSPDIQNDIIQRLDPAANALA